ncbi:hypothetical protein GCM10022254_67490 [Actinomadura meridiana]|uniref:CAAX prenyl protease 2/Lysostaphin resistance protein A-like domain-containing protein n=1 Tax=Actinomadura meridiana TaxID=559626 RepID=A0ABP8CLP6_9ACTN
MSEPGDDDGWAPLDPVQRPTDPPTVPPAGAPVGPPAQPPVQPLGPPERPGPHWQAYGGGYPGYPSQPGYSGYPGYPGYPPHGYGPPPVKRPWTVEAPKGAPFHRLARTEAHRWWRPLVGTLAIAGVGMVLALALMLAGMIIQVAATGHTDTSGTSDTIFGDQTADLAYNLAALGLFLPVVLFAAWGVQRRRPGTLSSVAGRLRWRWLLACCGLAFLFCLVSFGTSAIAGAFVDDTSTGDEHWVGWGDFLLPAVVIVFLVPVQSAAEEYMFRGWLLQAVGAHTLENSRRRIGQALSVVFRTPWPGIVIGSALFTSGHGYTGWGILDIFTFGAVAAWLAVRTGGLESGIALHVFNNLMAFLLPAAVGELDIEQGGVAWQVVVADVVPMLLYAAAVTWLARRMRVETVTGAKDDVPVSPPEHPARVS